MHTRFPKGDIYAHMALDPVPCPTLFGAVRTGKVTAEIITTDMTMAKTPITFLPTFILFNTALPRVRELGRTLVQVVKASASPRKSFCG